MRRPRRSTGVKIDRAVQLFIQSRKAKNVSKRTVQWYEWQLGEFLKYPAMPRVVTLIRPSHIRDYLAAGYDQGLSDNTVNGRYRALSALFTFLYEEGIIMASPVASVDKPKVEKVMIKTFTEKDLKNFFRVIDRSTFHGIRDYCLFLILLDTGVRITELLNVRQKDLFLEAKHIFVHGKGGKERLVPFGQRVYGALTQWLEVLGKHEWLFICEDETQLQYRTVDNNCKKYGRRAGITDKRVSCHTFRHTFAVNYLRNGGDTRSLQEILGHSSYAMMQRYTQLLDEDIKNIHRKASPVDRLKL